jgi:hypothetical protein
MKRFLVKYGNLIIDTEKDDEAVWMAGFPKDAKKIAELMNKIDKLEKKNE